MTSGAGSRTWQRPRTAAVRLEDARPRGSQSPAAWFQRTTEAGQCAAGLESGKGALSWLQVPEQTGLYGDSLNEAISEDPKEYNKCGG